MRRSSKLPSGDPRPLAAGLKHALGDAAAMGRGDKVVAILDKNLNTGQYGTAATKLGRAALLRACIADQLAMVQLLVGRGAEVNSVDVDSGRTALLHCAILGRPRIAQFLLDKAATTEDEDTQFLRTALGWAAFTDNVEIARMLLEAGADVHAVDRAGCTPLMWASDRGFVALARLLLRNGARTEVQENRRGYTALALAAASGHAEIVAMLLEHGACRRGGVVHGREPLTVAAQAGYVSVVEVLLDEARQRHERKEATCEELACGLNALGEALLALGRDADASARFGEAARLWRTAGVRDGIFAKAAAKAEGRAAAYRPHSAAEANKAASRCEPQDPTLRNGGTSAGSAAQLFSLLDRDNSGRVSREELRRALRADASVRRFCSEHVELSGLLKARFFDAVFDTFDGDGSGELDFDEFLQTVGVVHQEARLEAEAERLFNLLDTDGSGELEKSELASTLQPLNFCEDSADSEGEGEIVRFCRKFSSLSALLRPRTFTAAFESMDDDGSGTIGRSEFLACCALAAKTEAAAAELFSVLEDAALSRAKLLKMLFRGDPDVSGRVRSLSQLRCLQRPRTAMRAFEELGIDAEASLDIGDLVALCAVGNSLTKCEGRQREEGNSEAKISEAKISDDLVYT